MYFKLYINGRHIISWGLDLKAQFGGSVVKSLWSPCDRFDDCVGIESRNFVFLPSPAGVSAADDGGLVEVRAFRARDRRPRAPKLEQFRHCNNYGIA